jgi:hypothetical protein
LYFCFFKEKKIETLDNQFLWQNGHLRKKKESKEEKKKTDHGEHSFAGEVLCEVGKRRQLKMG